MYASGNWVITGLYNDAMPVHCRDTRWICGLKQRHHIITWINLMLSFAKYQPLLTGLGVSIIRVNDYEYCSSNHHTHSKYCKNKTKQTKQTKTKTTTKVQILLSSPDVIFGHSAWYLDTCKLQVVYYVDFTLYTTRDALYKQGTETEDTSQNIYRWFISTYIIRCHFNTNTRI